MKNIYLHFILQIKKLLTTFLILCYLVADLHGCSSSNCCDNTVSCGDSNCCNQCQIRCRTSTCLSNCRQDCCTSSAPCQSSNCFQTSCRRASSCFNNCQSRCSQDVAVCSNQCSRSCCGDSGSYDGSCCTTPTSTSSEVISRIITTNGGGGAKSDSSSSRNDNSENISNNITTLLNLNNTIHNENKIEVPINISNINTINVNIVPSDNVEYSNVGETSIIQKEIDREQTVVQKPVTETVRVPVEVPVQVPIPIPIPVPAPQQTSSCCNMVVPCVQTGCQSVRRVCGQQCTNNIMYAPVNPCQQGCSRRPFAIGNSCSMSGYCRQTMMDCSSCDINSSFNTYQGYQQCGGCFYSN